jgi:hypothetical protein
MTEAMGLQGQAATSKQQALTSLRHLASARDEVLDIIPALGRVRALGTVSPAIPTMVIVASLAPDEQVAPARRTCRGWVLDAAGSTRVRDPGVSARGYPLVADPRLELGPDLPRSHLPVAMKRYGKPQAW